MAEEGDTEAEAFFRKHLGSDELAYSCLCGLLKTIGRKAYPEAVAVIASRKYSLGTRVSSVREIAEHSGYPFDREVPAELLECKEKHLHLKELKQWAADGFPNAKESEAEIPEAKLKGLGIVLPKEYLVFLRKHDGRSEYVFKSDSWRLATADSLLKKGSIDGKSVPYIRQMRVIAKSIAESFESDDTSDDCGRPYPFTRLAEGIAIGSDVCGDVLLLDPADKMSVWAFHHDGGDVEKLAVSFDAFLKKAKKE